MDCLRETGNTRLREKKKKKEKKSTPQKLLDTTKKHKWQHRPHNTKKNQRKPRHTIRKETQIT